MVGTLFEFHYYIEERGDVLVIALEHLIVLCENGAIVLLLQCTVAKKTKKTKSQ